MKTICTSFAHYTGNFYESLIYVVNDVGKKVVIHSWWGYKLVQNCWMSVWQYLTKLCVGKGSLLCSLSDPTWPQKNGPWAWNTSFPRDKGLTLPVLGFPPRVGIPFPASVSVGAPLFCLSSGISGPLACLQLSVFQTPWGRGWDPCAAAQEECMWVNCPALAAGGDPPAMSDWPMHTIGVDLAVYSLCGWKHCSIQDLTALYFPWWLQCQDSMGRCVWTSVPGGWLSDDLCCPPHSWSPPLALGNKCMVFWTLHV